MLLAVAHLALAIPAGAQTTYLEPTDHAVALLPSGFLSTRGSSIVNDQGSPVRLACIQWHGLNEKNSQPDGWNKVSLETHLSNMIAAGFNCIRIAWTDAGISGSSMDSARQIITAARPMRLRVILAHFNNEGVSHDPTGWACLAQQVNGLWFDKGPGTNGTDGCNDPGTVTVQDFQKNWVSLAKMFAGNPAVVAMDLHNEPTSAGHISWGSGGPTDIHAMCTNVGNAIQAINPDVLIGCPCPSNYQGSFAGTGIAPEGDCTAVRTKPVTLGISNKLFYIVHEYPRVVSAIPVDSGPAYLNQMNRAWGYLITEDIAPVWMGEGGASLDRWSKNLGDERAWAATIGPYLNGKAPGGLTIPAGGQGVGTCWHLWSHEPHDNPDGALQSDWLSMKPEQAALYSQWRQDPVRPPRQ